MDGEQDKNFSGRITSGIKLRESVLEIINFISVQLPLWRDDPERDDIQSEHKLNSQLCDYLDSRARQDLPMFRFHHEEEQLDIRRVDLSAKPIEKVIIEAQTFNKYDPVLVIECKRLPAPSSDREKEYVSGQSKDKITGGIQRFKLCLHGAKHNLAAMVGYIQDEGGAAWIETINKWIKELAVKPIGDGCVWSDDKILYLLENNTETGIIKCNSKHGRIDNNNDIEIYHIWISMRNKSASNN